MLNKIIDFSIKNKLITGLFIIGLIAYGSYEFTKLPIDAVPDITNNQVQVITVAPSLGATDIERLVTFPVELANNNIAGLKEIRSFSRFGLSLVTIVFDDDVDIYWARQQVAERIQQVQSEIPEGMASVSLAPVTTGLGEIYQYVVKPAKGYKDQYGPMELRTIQDWIVRRQLLGVKGVAEVSSFGGNLKQYEIAVTPSRLHGYGLTIDDVFTALEKNNQNTGGAYIEHKSTVLYIRSEGLVGSIDDIRNISIKNLSNGTPLLIMDVAEVSMGKATRYGALAYNDEGEVSGAVVMMLKGANSSEVIEDVKTRIEQIRKTLPEGVEIEPFLDRTKMVENAINTVKVNLLEGALIVLVVLIIFLGNIRAGFLIASVIPLSMLFAVIMMNQFGVVGNLMSLGALDFGLIVDGSVFIVEAVLHQLATNKRFQSITRIGQHEMDLEVSKASGKIARSVVFGQVIILIVYLPTFTLQGIEGKMFIPMAQTVAFALLGAFILSLTYVPMMSSLIISKKIQKKRNFSDKMMLFFERHYQHALQKVLNFRKTVILSSLALFAVSIMVLMRMGGEFIPALEEGDFAVETRVLTGSNIQTTLETTQKAAKILKEKFPEVITVVTKIGSSEIPTDPMPMDVADMIVNLKDKSEWTSAKTFNELAEKMTESLKDVPGITVSFQYPVQMRFNELMTGAKQDVVCKIFGEDMDTLARYSKLLGELSLTVEGTKDLYVEPISGIPQLVIEYDRKMVSQYGLNISDINRIVNASMAGQSAGLVYEGEKRFDMVVRLSGEERNDIDDIRNILIPTPEGMQVPLSHLAKVDLKDSPNQIQREDAKRRVIVGFNVGSRDVQSIVNELQAKVNEKLKLPTGYYISYGGAFENLNAAKARLAIAVPVSLLLIFLLLFFSFNSIRQGLLIYSAIPLSAIGGIFALSLRDMPFSISAGVGFIALFGVAVLNGIVLVAEFNRLKASGMTDLRKIVLTGTKIRLRPVLMTGLVASLGFLPMALSNSSGAEVQRPLATVVIGGLLIATALTLFVLPVLYMIFEKKAPSPGKAVGLIVMAFFTLNTVGLKAQSTISLKAAMDTAVKNNLTLRNESLVAEYHRKLIATGFDIPQTNLAGEYGQINSVYKDNKINVSQGFNFPSLYIRQRAFLKETWREAQMNQALQQAELKKEVATLFFRIITLEGKQKVLLRADSIYQGFRERSRQRFNVGESDVLEKITAEVHSSQVRFQLDELQTDLSILLDQFRLMLNTSKLYRPDMNGKLTLSTVADTSTLRSHPRMQLVNQQKKTSLAGVRVERSKLLPELSLGYNSMTILGTGPDGLDYDASKRFQSATIGIGIPIFFNAQTARIKSAKTLNLISENNYELESKKLSQEYQNALTSYELARNMISKYETEVIKNIQLLSDAADQKFKAGDISYLEWTMLIDQTFEVESQYIDAQFRLNESIIKLNFLLEKN